MDRLYKNVSRIMLFLISNLFVYANYAFACEGSALSADAHLLRLVIVGQDEKGDKTVKAIYRLEAKGGLQVHQDVGLSLLLQNHDQVIEKRSALYYAQKDHFLYSVRVTVFVIEPEEIQNAGKLIVANKAASNVDLFLLTPEVFHKQRVYTVREKSAEISCPEKRGREVMPLAYSFAIEQVISDGCKKLKGYEISDLYVEGDFKKLQTYQLIEALKTSEDQCISAAGIRFNQVDKSFDIPLKISADYEGEYAVCVLPVGLINSSYALA